LEGLKARFGTGWDDPRLRAADLQWCDVRPERSLAARLAAGGAVEVLFPAEEVERAAATPPPSTRAYLRGEAVRRFGPAVVSAGWDAVTLDAGGQWLTRLGFPDPARGGRAEVGPLLAAAGGDPLTFLAALSPS
ncbi:MAG: proteasome accessory factor PafA2 family protein, partial [Bifidobacteriaceae bacterium]|nr:proteasome accessory factor PafA2 family protein [Bifidobacteriaceae bacterium]